MGKFSRLAPAPTTPDDWVQQPHREDEGPGSNTDTNTDIGVELSRAPWDGLNPKAASKNLFNLRLNDYYLAILRHLATLDEDKSMQRLVKDILLPELRRLADEHRP